MRTGIVTLLLALAWTGLRGQDLSIASFTIDPTLMTDAKSVVRDYEVEYRLVKDNTAELSYRKVITVLDDDHEYEQQLVAFYDDDSRLTDFKVTLFDTFGNKMVSSKKADEKDQLAYDGVSFMQDSRVKHTKVYCDSYPCTIELTYRKRMSDMAAVAGLPTFRPQRFGQSVQHARLTVRVPTDNEVNHETRNTAAPTVSTDGDERVYVWEVADLPAVKSEDYAPASSHVLPYAELSLRDVKIDGYTGSFADWTSFGEFMYQLHEGRQELPAELATLVRSTVAGATTDVEKIDRLYRLLQQRTRYVSVQLGIGGWQPFSAEYVEENRYGDCKALSNYMGAMLAEVGIESYPVIVHWEENPDYEVGEELATPSFNHMILYVPGEEMYLECTSNLSPTGYLGSGKDDRYVVWLTPEGGKLVRTPALVPAENGYTRTTDLTVDAEGHTRYQLHASYYGAAQERLRFLSMEEADPKEQKDRLHAKDYLPNVVGTDFTFTSLTDEPRTELRYTTDLSSYVRTMGKRMFIPLNRYAGTGFTPPEEYEDRKLPVDFDVTRFYVDTVNLQLPPGMEFESIGELETVYEHAIGNYRSVITPREDGLRWVRTLRLQPATLPAAEYADFREFLVNVNKADSRRVVAREKRTK